MMCLLEGLPCPRDGIALSVNQPLDVEHHLNIAAAIEPLSGTALVGLQLRKLGFPETQNVRFHFTDLGDIANLEIETVRYCWSFEDALAVKLSSHVTKGESMRGDQAHTFFHLKYICG